MALGAVCALGQVAMTGAGLPTPAGGGGGALYPTGPGDVVASAKAWYGLRAYTHALAVAGPTTTPVIDVAGSSSGSCTIYLKGDGTGGLDFTTSGAGGVGHQCASGATTFCTVTNTSCTVSKFYDQSGALACTGSTACNLTQATAADQPTLTFNCIGSLPCLTFNGTSTDLDTTAGPSSVSQPLTYSHVAKNTGTTQSTIVWDTGVQNGFRLTSAANTTFLYAGSAVGATAADSANHSLVDVANGASSKIYVDGVATTVNPSTSGTGGAWHMGSTGASQFLAGTIAESGLWGSGFSGAQAANMCANQEGYYGSGNFTTSCLPYVGPGDIVTGATFWYGLRAYNNSVANAGATTTKVVDVAGSSSGSCTIFLLGNGTGALDLTTSGAGGVGNQCASGATTFCTVTNTSCTISKWYDQSGNGINVTQATGANQPTLTFSCIGSLPCLTFNSSSDVLTNGSYTTNANPTSASMVVSMISVAAQRSIFYDGADQIGVGNTSGNAFVFNGATFTLGAFSATTNHAMQIMFSTPFYGTPAGSNIDGVSTNIGVLEYSPSAVASINLGSAGGGQYLNGTMAEFGLWSKVIFTSDNQKSICRNQQSYYGSGNFGAVC